MKAIFSQVTDKGINEIYESYIDETITDKTESHSMKHSHGMEEYKNQFEINFSSYQLIGAKNVEKKSLLQIEFFDTNKDMIIARSDTFRLSDLVKTIPKENTYRGINTTDFEITFNNLIANTMSKFLSFTNFSVEYVR